MRTHCRYPDSSGSAVVFSRRPICHDRPHPQVMGAHRGPRAASKRNPCKYRSVYLALIDRGPIVVECSA